MFKYAIISLDGESRNIEAESFCSPSSGAPACTRTFSQARSGAAVHAPSVPFLHDEGSQDPDSPFPSPSLSSVPSPPMHLGSTWAPSFVTMPCSDYPNMALSSLTQGYFLKNTPCHSPFSRTSVECSLSLSNLLPTSLVKLISCCLHSLHSSHILNLEAKFMDFGIRQSTFKSWLHHWPAVGRGRVSQFPPQSQLHICQWGN